MAEQLDKFKELASGMGLDADALITELSDSIEAGLAGKLKAAMENVEIKLGQKIEQIGRDTGQSLSTMVNTAVTAQLPSMVDKVGNEFMTKLKEGGGSPAGGNSEGRGGGIVSKLLANATLDDIVSAYKVYKEPTTAEALRGQMQLLIQGLSMGLRLKTSPEIVTDLAKTIDRGLGGKI